MRSSSELGLLQTFLDAQAFRMVKPDRMERVVFKQSFTLVLLIVTSHVLHANDSGRSIGGSKSEGTIFHEEKRKGLCC